MMLRFLFDSPQAAAQGLRAVLQHARSSQDHYTFGSLSLSQLTTSGLWITGDPEQIVGVGAVLDGIPGTVRQQSVVADAH